MKIEVLPNSEEYWDSIRCLRNDEKVKRGFINQDYITKDQQDSYMRSGVADKFIIVLVDGKFAGYAGSIDKDIRVCVSPKYQGKGVGVVLIKALMEKFPGSFAKIKLENTASIRLFEKCGFKQKYIIMEKDDGETQSV